MQQFLLLSLFVCLFVAYCFFGLLYLTDFPVVIRKIAVNFFFFNVGVQLKCITFFSIILFTCPVCFFFLVVICNP